MQALLLLWSTWFFTVQSQMQSYVVPQAIADKHGAKCLNGAPPFYELRNSTSDKWMLFLEGGGWCERGWLRTIGPWASCAVGSARDSWRVASPECAGATAQRPKRP
jgi:hypothetical protein